MNFQSYNLGYLHGGEIVEITIQGDAPNVRLLDSLNFSHYKNGRNHRYFGGHAKSSPVRIPVPHSGNWYVAIDFGGFAGRAKTAVRVLPGKLPEIKQRPLSSMPSLVLGRDDTPEYSRSNRTYDVFISHASEDKDAVVRPLANALRSHDLNVWYDEFTLSIGDSLRRKIDEGLAKSRFGIVVISRNFIAKGWTNYELDGLITRSVSGDQVLLPIWHEITKQEVIDYSPSLADKLARNTATNTVDEIADEIASVIKADR